mmetsp:Transcript_29257/g.46999  ORF Transcript_29257/g.46999 Transcript_29257/m.46999 type:complete len:210 (-) Transcript_29257:12-641(-)
MYPLENKYRNKIKIATKIRIFLKRSMYPSYRPSVSCFPASRVCNGYHVFSSTCSIAFLAPLHFPGPSSLHWEGVQGPNTSFRHKALSVKKSFHKLGLHPMYWAILSMYCMKKTTKVYLAELTPMDFSFTCFFSTSCILFETLGSLQFPEKTRAAHLACISRIGGRPPKGWTSPITARVGGSRSAGKTRSYKLGNALSIFTTSFWRKGKL